jgi:hypothetical protein
MSRLVKMVTNVSTASVPIQTLNICQKLFGAFTKTHAILVLGRFGGLGPFGRIWEMMGLNFKELKNK